MKIIEAKWEKRNLGVNCTEILIDREDSEGCLDEIRKNESEYTVVKVSIENTKLLMMLQDKGYKYIETNIQMKKNLYSEFLYPEIYERILRRLDTVEVDKSQHEIFLQKLEKMDIFDKDKISLDAFFSVKQSNQRYANWSRDILHNSGSLFEIINEQEKVGFFIINRKSEDVCESFLAGIYPKYKNSGFGFASIAFPLIESKKKGYKYIVTGTSINNFSSLKIHLEIGYRITNSSHVLVKHI